VAEDHNFETSGGFKNTLQIGLSGFSADFYGLSSLFFWVTSDNISLLAYFFSPLSASLLMLFVFVSVIDNLGWGYFVW